MRDLRLDGGATPCLPYGFDRMPVRVPCLIPVRLIRR